MYFFLIIFSTFAELSINTVKKCVRLTYIYLNDKRTFLKIKNYNQLTIIPGYGWAVSSAYFLGKNALEYNDLDIWNK